MRCYALVQAAGRARAQKVDAWIEQKRGSLDRLAEREGTGGAVVTEVASTEHALALPFSRQVRSTA
jgi:hypothetical protein